MQANTCEVARMNPLQHIGTLSIQTQQAMTAYGRAFLLDDKKAARQAIADLERAIQTMKDLTSATVPAVGMGATMGVGSDRYPYTITSVTPSGKCFWMKQDLYARKDSNGMSESQDYHYTPNPDASEVSVRQTSRGWTPLGGRPGCVHIGARSAYQDPHF